MATERYFFEPLSEYEANGTEDNGDIWEHKDGAYQDRCWICTCHKDDAPRLISALSLLDEYTAEQACKGMRIDVTADEDTAASVVAQLDEMIKDLSND